MITSLITFLILALICYLIFWILGKFVQGVPLQILGIILALILLLYALRLFGLVAL